MGWIGFISCFVTVISAGFGVEYVQRHLEGFVARKHFED